MSRRAVSAVPMRRAALVFAACYACAELGLPIPCVDSQIALLWLPSAIAIAAFQAAPTT